MNDKEKLRATIESKLSAFDETIEELSQKAKSRGVDIKEAVGESLGEIERKKQAAAAKVEESLSQTNGDAWEEVKNEVHAYLDDIDDRLRRAMAYFAG